MGTRHLLCVFKDKKFKMIQYGHCDGYPSFTGLKILELMRDYKEYPNKYVNLDHLRMVYKEDQSFLKIIQTHAVDVLDSIIKLNLRDYSTVLAGNISNIEYVYVINLDDEKLYIKVIQNDFDFDYQYYNELGYFNDTFESYDIGCQKTIDKFKSKYVQEYTNE